MDLKCAESFHQSFEIEAKVFCFFLTKNGANFVTEMFCLEKAANINTNFFQNRLKLVENLLMPVIANDNFQAPTEMEVDFNQQNYGNPNEIRQPEGIGIKNGNKVSIFNQVGFKKNIFVRKTIRWLLLWELKVS